MAKRFRNLLSHNAKKGSFSSSAARQTDRPNSARAAAISPSLPSAALRRDDTAKRIVFQQNRMSKAEQNGTDLLWGIGNDNAQIGGHSGKENHARTQILHVHAQEGGPVDKV